METHTLFITQDSVGFEGASHWNPPDQPRPQRRPGLNRARGRDNVDRSASRFAATRVTAYASDESLILRLRAGDVAAGEALVSRYCGPLMRYLQRLAGNAAAEDLHQQTWVSVLAHVDRFVAGDNSSSFRGWLFRIASNKTKDYWRSARREKAAKEAMSRMGAGEAPWAGGRADGAEQQEKLRRAIENLSESQRDVLMMRYYGNFKFQDIARILGCPVNTALTRAHKGLLKLREAMGQEPRPVTPRMPRLRLPE